MKDRLAGNSDPSLVGPNVIVAVAEAKRGRKQPQAAARLPVENELSLGVVGDGLAEIEPGSCCDHREVSESRGWDEPDRALSFPDGFTPFPAPLSLSAPSLQPQAGLRGGRRAASHGRGRTARNPVGEGRDEAEVPRARRCAVSVPKMRVRAPKRR